MDQAQQRVAIAQDALAWIEAGALIPSEGTYVMPSAPLDTIFPYGVKENEGKQLRDVELGKCKVCAKGALFLAKAVRFDKVLVPSNLRELIHQVSSDDDGVPLREHFSKDQLWLIEKCFEGWDLDKTFYFQYPDPKERLIAILNNIIQNKGTFIP